MSQHEELATTNPGAAGETDRWVVDFERLVKLLSTSLYAEASAVIRELLTNANDALYRRKVEYGFNGQEPECRIWLDSQAGRLIVRDNGIGMSKQDLKEYLATIAAGFSQSDSDLIGQFGIGFLSSFMVANTVTVETRKLTEQEGYRWISLKKKHRHDPDYEIIPKFDLEIGTTVILDLKSEFRLEWNEDAIKTMVREQAGNFAFSIYWGRQGSMKLNELQAPWYTDKPLTDEDTEIVRKDLVDYSPRFASAHSANEIIPLYADDVRGVVYIPPYVDIQSDWTGGMDLYCRRVFVKKNEVDILPEEFRFARGVIDCSKFSLTLARDDVFHDPIYHAIRELIGTQIMGHFRKLANAATNYAGPTSRTSAENKSEIASVRLQTALE
jgi:molecular chaperone HtpG